MADVVDAFESLIAACSAPALSAVFRQDPPCLQVRAPGVHQDLVEVVRCKSGQGWRARCRHSGGGAVNSSESKEVATGPLELLAAQLRGLGLTVAALEPDRTSFPALLVGAGTAKAVVMAGAVHFWRREASGDMRFVGALDEPEKAAHAVHGYLTDDPERSRSHRFRFRPWAPIGRLREMAGLAPAPTVAMPGVGR